MATHWLYRWASVLSQWTWRGRATSPFGFIPLLNKHTYWGPLRGCRGRPGLLRHGRWTPAPPAWRPRRSITSSLPGAVLVPRLPGAVTSTCRQALKIRILPQYSFPVNAPGFRCPEKTKGLCHELPPLRTPHLSCRPRRWTGAAATRAACPSLTPRSRSVSSAAGFIS